MHPVHNIRRKDEHLSGIDEVVANLIKHLSSSIRHHCSILGLHDCGSETRRMQSHLDTSVEGRIINRRNNLN